MLTSVIGCRSIPEGPIPSNYLHDASSTCKHAHLKQRHYCMLGWYISDLKMEITVLCSFHFLIVWLKFLSRGFLRIYSSKHFSELIRAWGHRGMCLTQSSNVAPASSTAHVSCSLHLPEVITTLKILCRSESIRFFSRQFTRYACRRCAGAHSNRIKVLFRKGPCLTIVHITHVVLMSSEPRSLLSWRRPSPCSPSSPSLGSSSSSYATKRCPALYASIQCKPFSWRSSSSSLRFVRIHSK